MKRLKSDYCLFRNGYARQARTAGERAFSNGHHAARYCDVYQAITFCKRKISDFGHAIRAGDAGHARAIVEGIAPDFFQAI